MKHKKVNKENAVEILHVNDGIEVVFLSALTYKNSDLYDDCFDYKKYLKDLKFLKINLTDIKGYDSYLVIFINEIEDFCKNKNIEFILAGVSEDLQRFYDTINPKNDRALQGPDRHSFFVQYFTHVGETVKLISSDAYKFVEFLGSTLYKSFILMFRPNLLRWEDFPDSLTKSGVNAVPIVSLIVFLIGLITGYQGAMQLSQFGADIYIANLVGISITRELSPLMAAIIVAGRSGSSFAAEIGTMKVSEEIDALTTMGFDPYYFLVLPRVLSVAIALPALTLIADIAGIGGGLLAALATLNITITGFVNQLQLSLSFMDVLSGVFKAYIFGFLIATVGCFRGFQVRGGAESVGRYTTASVVTGIFLVILIDALFVFIFQALGL